jgi:pyridoxamine 5'-phosphate oxidase
MTSPFSNEEIALARRLKALALRWEPQAGHYACEDADDASGNARMHLVADLGRILTEFGSIDALRERLTWLPDWHDARRLLRGMGVRDDEVLARLAREGYFASGRELLGLYRMLLERLEGPAGAEPRPPSAADRRAARLDAAVVPQEPLTEESASLDPLALFARWFEEALAASHIEPTAVALATVAAGGGPAVRMVLLKGFDERGFVFYTNQASRKGRELASCPAAALAIWWDVNERQVRIEGCVEPTSPAESDAYFATRPLGSQLGAWASPQSEAIPNRAALEAAFAEAEKRFAGRPVPRPPHWGGYRLIPEMLEFWQGRPDRLHDRLRYDRTSEGRWTRTRLAP